MADTRFLERGGGSLYKEGASLEGGGGPGQMAQPSVDGN